MTKAAQQKRASRQNVIYVDGKQTTNREIERKRDRKRKRYKLLVQKTAQKRIKGSGKNQEKQEIATLVPSVYALTVFTSKENAAGEYRAVKNEQLSYRTNTLIPLSQKMTVTH